MMIVNKDCLTFEHTYDEIVVILNGSNVMHNIMVKPFPFSCHTFPPNSNVTWANFLHNISFSSRFYGLTMYVMTNNNKKALRLGN